MTRHRYTMNSKCDALTKAPCQGDRIVPIKQPLVVYCPELEVEDSTSQLPDVHVNSPQSIIEGRSQQADMDEWRRFRAHKHRTAKQYLKRFRMEEREAGMRRSDSSNDRSSDADAPLSAELGAFTFKHNDKPTPSPGKCYTSPTGTLGPDAMASIRKHLASRRTNR